jgi:predicted kinase
MPIIFVMIGLPGSGKSTWAIEKAKDDDTVIINRDAIRTMIKGKYIFDKDLEPFIKAVAKLFVYEAITEGLNVVVDETNLTIEKRKFWNIKNIDTVFVWCKESKRNADLRCASDARGYSKEYWEDVIKGMKLSFEPPTLNEYAKEIIEVCI